MSALWSTFQLPPRATCVPMSACGVHLPGRREAHITSCILGHDGSSSALRPMILGDGVTPLSRARPDICEQRSNNSRPIGSQVGRDMARYCVTHLSNVRKHQFSSS